MAWNILRDGLTSLVSEEKTRVSAIRVIINGALLNVLNPTLLLFFLAFLLQFVSAELATSTGMLVWLALVFMVLTFIIFVVYGACAFLARTYVLSRPIVLRWSWGTFAGAFGLLGLRLTLSDRCLQISLRSLKFGLGTSFFQFPPLPRPRRHHWQRARHLPRPAHLLPCGSGSS